MLKDTMTKKYSKNISFCIIAILNSITYKEKEKKKNKSQLSSPVAPGNLARHEALRTHLGTSVGLEKLCGLLLVLVSNTS